MLCSVSQLKGCTIAARDGDIGSVSEVYFDDQRWVIRHLVVDTGGWLTGRNVLVSPHAISRIDLAAQRVETTLSREQIEQAPDIDAAKPVSRQHEIPYYDYYGYPYYWAGAGLWGAAAFPLAGGAIPAATPAGGAASDAERDAAEAEPADPNLRSSAEVVGYHIEASDGGIGHIEDFVFDDRSWAIRYAAVDTRNWLPGRHVLVSPQWIDSVSWSDRKVFFNVTREAVKESPPFDKQNLPNQPDEEQRLSRHYGRDGTAG